MKTEPAEVERGGATRGGSASEQEKSDKAREKKRGQRPQIGRGKKTRFKHPDYDRKLEPKARETGGEGRSPKTRGENGRALKGTGLELRLVRSCQYQVPWGFSGNIPSGFRGESTRGEIWLKKLACTRAFGLNSTTAARNNTGEDRGGG